MKLTDLKCRQLKPEAKKYRRFDGKGMYLEVMPNGSKYWRVKYRFTEKEKLFSIGVYPEISLKEARESLEEFRKLLREGKDPSQERKASKRQEVAISENLFENIARDWHEKKKAKWTHEHGVKMINWLERDIFPSLGNRPVADITPSEVLTTIRKIEARGALDIARRLYRVCRQIFSYGIANEKLINNPADHIADGLQEAPPVQHRAHLAESDLPEFLAKLKVYDGDIQTVYALKLMFLTFIRVGELRAGRWEEINFEKAEWRIPQERMKMREQHIVPLSKQAIEILQELKLLTSHREHIFPNQQKPRGHMSENTLLGAFWRMGYKGKATPHGIRATASTILNENGWRSDVIERQLAHGERNKVRAAYNHAEYLQERKEMMQWWADYLDVTMKEKVIVGNFSQNSA